MFSTTHICVLERRTPTGSELYFVLKGHEGPKNLYCLVSLVLQKRFARKFSKTTAEECEKFSSGSRASLKNVFACLRAFHYCSESGERSERKSRENNMEQRTRQERTVRKEVSCEKMDKGVLSLCPGLPSSSTLLFHSLTHFSLYLPHKTLGQAIIKITSFPFS